LEPVLIGTQLRTRGGKLLQGIVDRDQDLVRVVHRGHIEAAQRRGGRARLLTGSVSVVTGDVLAVDTQIRRNGGLLSSRQGQSIAGSIRRAGRRRSDYMACTGAGGAVDDDAGAGSVHSGSQAADRADRLVDGSSSALQVGRSRARERDRSGRVV